MINNLIDGISIKLNQVFGDEVNIYSDNVKQGLEEPCFFIAVLSPSNKKLLGSRSFRDNPFDIHYFPKVIGDNLELNDVASKLYEALEYITLTNGDLIRGSKMSYQTVDDVLHFFVNFNMFVKNAEIQADPMESLVVNNKVKG